MKRTCQSCGKPFTTSFRHKKCTACKLQGARTIGWMPHWERIQANKHAVEANLSLKGLQVRWINDWRVRRFQAVVSYGDIHVRMCIGKTMKRAQMVAKIYKKGLKPAISYDFRCSRNYIHSQQVTSGVDGRGRPRHLASMWNRPGQCFCDSCCMRRFILDEVDTPSRILQIKQWEQRIKSVVQEARKDTAGGYTTN